MAEEPTPLYKRWLIWLQNKWFLAPILIFGIVIIFIGQFFGAATVIIGLFNNLIEFQKHEPLEDVSIELLSDFPIFQISNPYEFDVTLRIQFEGNLAVVSGGYREVLRTEPLHLSVYENDGAPTFYPVGAAHTIAPLSKIKITTNADAVVNQIVESLADGASSENPVSIRGDAGCVFKLQFDSVFGGREETVVLDCPKIGRRL